MNFKKAISTLVIGLTTTLSGFAQYTDNDQYNYVNPEDKQVPVKMNNIFSVGFGVGGYYPYSGTMYVENPNVTLSYEKPVFKHIGPGNITLGELFSYKNIYSGYTDYTTDYDYIKHWNYYIFGTRVSYHFTPLGANRIEPYAGFMVGYYITHFRFTSTDPNYSEPGDPGYFLTTSNNFPNFVACSVFVGVRSWFNKHEGVWLEMGYGYTSFAFGLSYRI